MCVCALRETGWEIGKGCLLIYFNLYVYNYTDRNSRNLSKSFVHRETRKSFELVLHYLHKRTMGFMKKLILND